MFGCEMCHEWYHSACLGYKKKAEQAALAAANDWVCGYCKAEPDKYGDAVWDGKIGNSALVVKKAKLARNIESTPHFLGIGLNDPAFLQVIAPTWADLMLKVAEAGKKIRAEQKKRKGQAKHVIAEGGHHIVDARGNGGVQPRIIDGALVDDLEFQGLLHDEIEEVDDGSDVSMSE